MTEEAVHQAMALAARVRKQRSNRRFDIAQCTILRICELQIDCIGTGAHTQIGRILKQLEVEIQEIMANDRESA